MHKGGNHMAENHYSEITPELQQMAEMSRKASYIDPELYTKYDVKRGLRDLNGKGVLVGITGISEVNAKKEVNGKLVPCDGELFYRGYNVQDIVRDIPQDDHFGFEEIVYLLLFGELPDRKQLDDFIELLSSYRTLPKNFVRDIIMKKPSEDIMNSLARSVLFLYSYDENPDDTSPANVLRQCLELVAMFPLLSVYGYQVSQYYYHDSSLIIHKPDPKLSTAENILHCLRLNSEFTPLEAKLLDVCLILHAEHGGGNNSTFTTHLVSSSGTDTYSTIAAALGSLKGPRHGGANIKVVRMFDDLEKNIKDWKDEDEIRQYLNDILDKKAFDHSGLIYGMGHAVYSISDPRAVTFKGFVKQLSQEKGREDEYELHNTVARLAVEVISKRRKIYKGVCPNIDFYSGFAYQMLGLPAELYTSIFAIARIAGWSAHRMEEICQNSKIMRPAYMTVHPHCEFVAIDKRP